MQINGQPFERLRIAYFKVYNQKFEQIFLDATDEQILYLLAKQHHETVNIIKIEDVEVLSIVTVIPARKKLDDSELKSGLTSDEFLRRSEKFKDYQNKYK